MMKSQVRTPADALAYMTDCTLATVCRMAMRKSRAAGEYQRQIAIAEFGVRWTIANGVPIEGTRVGEVYRLGRGVAEWAKQFEPLEST